MAIAAKAPAAKPRAITIIWPDGRRVASDDPKALADAFKTISFIRHSSEPITNSNINAYWRKSEI